MIDADDPQIVAATQWLLRLNDEDASGEDVTEWQQWLAASPAHRAAFERAQSVWEIASRLSTVPWPTDREVALDTYDASVPIARARRVPHVLRQAHRLAVAAACMALAIGAAAIWYMQHSSHLLTTLVGENARFALADGSHVSLGGASKLHWSIDTKERAFTLQHGEGLFEVAKDPRRPFVVRAGDIQITAVGTTFNVRLASDRVQVAVTSGAVQITRATDAGAATRLDAGHQATVESGKVSAVAVADVPIVLARKEGRLQYASEPLRYVIADLSRYSAVPIDVRGTRTGDLLITGTVFEGDVNGWLQGLEKALPLRVSFSPHRIVISGELDQPSSVDRD